MQRIIPVLILNFLLIACMTSTRYQYADGNANVYVIKTDSLEYIPVKPEESSTGSYSGGAPKKISIRPEDFRSLQAMLETAKKKHEIHIPDRVKSSGMITTFSGSEKSNFILKPGCKEMATLESELKRLLQ